VTGPSRDLARALARARILLVAVCLIGAAAFIMFAVLAPADWWIYTPLAAGWVALAGWARSPLPERIKT
jgi:hypothetical protein